MAEYLNDADNGWFNRVCYEMMKEFYTSQHFEESIEVFDDRMLAVFNRAYQCAAANVDGRVIPDWGKTIPKVGEKHRVYIMPDGEDLVKYDLLPQVVIPLLYQILESYSANAPIGEIRTQIERAFGYEIFFKRLNAKLHDVSIRDIITYENKDRLLARIRELIEGQKGAAVGCVFARCRQLGYMSANPTRAQFESEFSIEGCSWQSIHKYMDPEGAFERANRIVIFPDEEI